eukprot:COSAG02_NODE_3148_length_7286_cov_24.818700_3_plen_61_part_00
MRRLGQVDRRHEKHNADFSPDNSYSLSIRFATLLLVPPTLSTVAASHDSYRRRLRPRLLR